MYLLVDLFLILVVVSPHLILALPIGFLNWIERRTKDAKRVVQVNREVVQRNNEEAGAKRNDYSREKDANPCIATDVYEETKKSCAKGSLTRATRVGTSTDCVVVICVFWRNSPFVS